MKLLKQNFFSLLQSKAFSWSALLAVSAFVSKLFGLWRDRLFVQFFAETNQLDLIFAAFRIPDFFFFLLISGTVATLFLPRYSNLESETDKQQFFQSFLSLFVVFFGLVCVAGFIAAPWLAQIFSPGLDVLAQIEIASLSRYLFGSVFLLCVSSVFSARLQAEQKFLSIALAPIVYMSGLCFGILYGAASFGFLAVGYGAIAGAALHLIANFGADKLQIRSSKTAPIPFLSLSPKHAWKNFRSDFLARVLNGSAFQINQTIDVVIASFLVAGSISAFSLGTTLGHFLLSIVGFSVAKVLFPSLSKAKHNWNLQQKILKKGVLLILGLTIPASMIAFGLSEWLLELFLTLSGEKLRLTNIVFMWTVASLPAACLCPLLSRFFLANEDTKTPLRSAVIALIIATTLAAILSLKILPAESAIIGLAIGNFVANYLNMFLLSWHLYRLQ
jgi:putative peptidoglycan lipid II flippase